MKPSLPVVLGVTTLVAFLLRWWTLSTGEPLGTDGYYYVVQLEDLVATGHPHVPDASWTLRALAIPHGLGMAVIPGLALAAAALATLPAALMGLGGTPRRVAAALLLAASPTLTHLAADFPKSLGLAAPWVVAISCLQASRTDRRWLLLAVPALLLMATAHRLGTVIAVLSVLGMGAAAAAEGRAPGKWLRGAAATAVLLALLSTVLLAAIQAPGLLHPDDLERLALLPSLRFAPWSWWSARPDTSWVQAFELMLPWLALLLLPLAWRRTPSWAGACALPLAATLAPIYPPDVLDLGYRVHLFAPLFAAPVLAAALPDRVRLQQVLAGVLMLPAACFGPAPSTMPPYDRYRDVLSEVPEPLPELLIAHQGMNFLYDHLTGREAMAWAPDPGFPDACVRRVAYGITPGEWLAVVQHDDPDVVPLGQGYHLVGEATWRRLVAGADDELAGRIQDWRNPVRTRPAYLLRRRPPTVCAPADR